MTYATAIHVLDLARELSISADTIHEVCAASGVDLTDGLLTNSQAEVIRTHLHGGAPSVTDAAPPVGPPADIAPPPTEPPADIAPPPLGLPADIAPAPLDIAPPPTEPPVDIASPATEAPAAPTHDDETYDEDPVIQPVVVNEVVYNHEDEDFEYEDVAPDEDVAAPAPYDVNELFDLIGDDEEPFGESDDSPSADGSVGGFVGKYDKEEHNDEDNENAEPGLLFRMFHQQTANRTTKVSGDADGHLSTGIAEEWRPRWFRVFLTAGLVAGTAVLLVLPSGQEATKSTAVAGQCYEQLVPGDLNSLAPVTCDDTHDFELIGLAEFPTTGSLAPYPDDETFEQFGSPLCSGHFETYTGRLVDQSRLQIAVAPPSPTEWIDGGFRTLQCLALDPSGPRVGSLSLESA